ncbi:MAG: calcium/sodium antiporter [Candidatus Pacebacteria bacterium]|nr:calcium/sodium antiporter [Candidatus Paceibacterota bacterium]
MTLFWIGVFIISLLVMLKGADWFLSSSEHVGLTMGLSPFIIGITIVAVGTSLPELITSLFAVFQGSPEIVMGNVVGSNIANIFLVMGIAIIIGKKLTINKDLINLDLPLLAASTVLFLVIATDGVITFPEAIILLVGHVIYFLYSIFYKEEHSTTVSDILIDEPTAEEKIFEPVVPNKNERPNITVRDIVFLVLGIAGLILGSKYLIESVIQLSVIFAIAPGVIAISAVAFGTSLPELLVSGMAAYKGKAEVAIGNIFGSNVFNVLVVAGIPALFTNLPIDPKTLTLGLPFLIIATVMFVISGISRNLYHWEGFFFILIYLVFIGKLFGFL